MKTQTHSVLNPAAASAQSRSWTSRILSAGLAAMVLWTLPAMADRDEGREGHGLVARPQSHAYGKTLGEWLGVYWGWNLRGQDEALSMVHGVKLIALPAGELISGTGTSADPALYRGQVEVTIDSETPFVMPLAAWITERYNNGTPEDAFFTEAQLLTFVSPHFTIDNHLVMSDCNEDQFYVPPTPLVPIVTYPSPTSYGSIAATGYQSIGVVGRPLPVGVHRIHLYESYIIPGMFGTIFDNTWIITVKKARHH